MPFGRLATKTATEKGLWGPLTMGARMLAMNERRAGLAPWRQLSPYFKGAAANFGLKFTWSEFSSTEEKLC